MDDVSDVTAAPLMFSREEETCRRLLSSGRRRDGTDTKDDADCWKAAVAPNWVSARIEWGLILCEVQMCRCCGYS